MGATWFNFGQEKQQVQWSEIMARAAGYFVNLFNDMKLKKTTQTFLALALCCWNRG